MTAAAPSPCPAPAADEVIWNRPTGLLCPWCRRLTVRSICTYVDDAEAGYSGYLRSEKCEGTGPDGTLDCCWVKIL